MLLRKLTLIAVLLCYECHLNVKTSYSIKTSSIFSMSGPGVKKPLTLVQPQTCTVSLKMTHEL